MSKPIFKHSDFDKFWSQYEPMGAKLSHHVGGTYYIKWEVGFGTSAEVSVDVDNCSVEVGWSSKQRSPEGAAAVLIVYQYAVNFALLLKTYMAEFVPQIPE